MVRGIEEGTTVEKHKGGVSYVVAVDGSDTNPGTESQPFASLARARDAVRHLQRSPRTPVTVWVRGGMYHLSAPFLLEAADSGSPEGPVTYAAYPGETPVLSGGKRITAAWEHWRDGIMKCSIAGWGEGRPHFSQLFVNGRRQIRARYPNVDSQDPLRGGYAYPVEGLTRLAEGAAESLGQGRPLSRGLRFDPATFTQQRWAKPAEAVLHIFPRACYGNLQWRLRKVDWERSVIEFGHGGFQLKNTLLDANSRFYVENVLEELDAPGEWYLDQEQAVLYYLPPQGVDLASAEVVAPRLEQLVELRGSQEAPIRHVTLAGFRLMHTTSIFLEPYEVLPSGDWCIHRSGAIFSTGAEDCAINNCFFDAVGGNGVFIHDYNRRIRVTGSKFTEAGESAICLVGSAERTIGTVEAFASDNTLSNNLIHDCGIFGKQVAGVFSSVSRRNTISHNVIYNMPRAGVCINDGLYGGHLIEFNDVHDTVRETNDHGPFNSWGRGRWWCLQHAHSREFTSPHGPGDVLNEALETTIIRNNYFRDHHGWGIDLDDGTSNYLVTHNLCVGISVKLREGAYRTVENNIFYLPVVPPGLHVGYDQNHDRFVRNIIVVDPGVDRPAEDASFLVESARGDLYQLIWPPSTPPWLELDHNLFYDPRQPFSVTVKMRDGSARKYTLAEWQALGYDGHSLFADPLFNDPDRGDFSLKPASPAWALGFEELDLQHVGLLPEFPAPWRD
jgi:hypothetical protein